jgi:hypothetical protein
MFMRLDAEKRHDKREMENVYYQHIYDILQNPEKRRRSMADVNKFKAKIIQLYSARMEAAKLYVEDRLTYKDEKASIYHIINQKSRREQRTRILDQTDSEQTTNMGIVAVFQKVQGRLSEVERDALDRPLDLEELRRVFKKGGGNKAPGRDGICWALLHGNMGGFETGLVRAVLRYV